MFALPHSNRPDPTASGRISFSLLRSRGTVEDLPGGALPCGLGRSRHRDSTRIVGRRHQRSSRWCAGSLVGKERHPPMLLEDIHSPADLRSLSPEQLAILSSEIRGFIVDTVTTTGGHLGSNLGVVELTLAVHRVFDSPRDVDPVGHRPPGLRPQAGDRAHGGLRHAAPAGGMSGYPNRPSPSTTGSRAATPRPPSATRTGWPPPSSCAGPTTAASWPCVGDGSLTGGMAYEALNNLGHAGSRW